MRDKIADALELICPCVFFLGLAAGAVTLAAVALRDCLRHEPAGERTAWSLICLVPYAGAAVYLLMRRPQRRRLIDPWLPAEGRPFEPPPGPAVGADEP